MRRRCNWLEHKVFEFAGLPLLQRTRDQAIFPVRSLARASTRLKRWVHRGAGQANFYLNSSHTQLEKVERFEWTKAASIKCIFFIHDLIPIDFPEYVSPRSPARHEGRLNTVSRLASGIIVNSDYTARSVAAYLDARKIRGAADRSYSVRRHRVVFGQE